MNFYHLNSKLREMENLMILCRLMATNTIVHIRLILLSLLLCVNAAGQEMQHLQTTDPFSRDTMLISRYMEEAGKDAISRDSALTLLNRALALARQHKLRRKMGIIWNSMGGKKLQQHDLAGCRSYLDSAFALNNQLKDPELTCMLNTLAATMYRFTANYAKAATHYFRAVHAVEEYHVATVSAAVMYNNLGGFMASLNEDSLAAHYLQLARQRLLLLQPVDTNLLINVLVILGNTLLKTDSVTAMRYLKEANVLISQFNKPSLSFYALINLSLSYVQLEQYDSAAHFLQLANAISMPGFRNLKAEITAGIIDYGKKNYDASEKHMLYALSLTHDEQTENLDAIYETLAKVHAARGEYQQAYRYHQEYLRQYKLLKGNADKNVADFMLGLQSMEHEKAILQKQAEISLGETAIKKQQFWIAAMCLVSVLLCVILVMAYRNYQHKKALLGQQMHTLLQEQEIERLKAEAEGADNERTRIAYDLHDGVMVRLANVKINLNGLAYSHPGFADTDRLRDIAAQLDMAGSELRNTAHNLMPEILLEDGLAQAIFYFCKTTEQASGLAIRFQQVGEPLPRLQIQVEATVYRIVQGLIQNVIQHAKASRLLVQLQYAENFCAVTVEDNGRGITVPEQAEGYGLKSIRNRTKILNGTFDIKSDPLTGTTAYIEFDVRPFIRRAS